MNSIIGIYNYQSSLELHININDIEQHCFISGIHEKNGVQTPIKIARMKTMKNKFNRNRISGTYEYLTQGINVFRFKYPNTNERWQSNSHLIVLILDNDKTEVQRLKVKSPARMGYQMKKEDCTDDSEEDYEEDSESDNSIPPLQPLPPIPSLLPRISQLINSVSQTPKKPRVEQFHIEEYRDLEEVHEVQESKKLDFWDLLKTIETNGPDQIKILDEKIASDEKKIQELEMELHQRIQSLEDARDKKRRIERISS